LAIELGIITSLGDTTQLDQAFTRVGKLFNSLLRVSAVLVFAVCAQAQLAIDKVVSTDQNNSSSSITSPVFSTAQANEQIVVFVENPAANVGQYHVSTLTGAGLSWAFVKRANGVAGLTEIWHGFATTVLTNVSVTATLSCNCRRSLTVVSFSGASSALGASAAKSAASGAPNVALTRLRIIPGCWAMATIPQR
jgi:hypothetical protein